MLSRPRPVETWWVLVASLELSAEETCALQLLCMRCWASAPFYLLHDITQHWATRQTESNCATMAGTAITCSLHISAAPWLEGLIYLNCFEIKFKILCEGLAMVFCKMKQDSSLTTGKAPGCGATVAHWHRRARYNRTLLAPVAWLEWIHPCAKKTCLRSALKSFLAPQEQQQSEDNPTHQFNGRRGFALLNQSKLQRQDKNRIRHGDYERWQHGSVATVSCVPVGQVSGDLCRPCHAWFWRGSCTHAPFCVRHHAVGNDGKKSITRLTTTGGQMLSATGAMSKKIKNEWMVGFRGLLEKTWDNGQ